jgi:hypothetical protein
LLVLDPLGIPDVQVMVKANAPDMSGDTLAVNMTAPL